MSFHKIWNRNLIFYLSQIWRWQLMVECAYFRRGRSRVRSHVTWCQTGTKMVPVLPLLEDFSLKLLRGCSSRGRHFVSTMAFRIMLGCDCPWPRPTLPAVALNGVAEGRRRPTETMVLHEWRHQVPQNQHALLGKGGRGGEGGDGEGTEVWWPYHFVWKLCHYILYI